MQRELVRRVRWGNVGRAAATVAVASAVVAWPRLGPAPPRVPSGAAVPIVAGPESAPARRRVTPAPTGTPRETARIARGQRRPRVVRRRGQAARPARPRPVATPTAAARPLPAATPTAAARPRPAATPTAAPAHTPSKRRPAARRARRPSPADEFGFER